MSLFRSTKRLGAVAQLGEHLVCNQKVVGSIPIRSTTRNPLPERPRPWLKQRDIAPSTEILRKVAAAG
jgi:hypothetical protein